MNRQRPNTSPAKPLLIWIVGLPGAAALLLAGCAPDVSGGSEAPVSTTEVVVDDDVFEPTAIEVEPGTEVTWTWIGDNTHNVVGDEFTSEPMSHGTFRHTFAEAGTYPYQCSFHRGMTGTVVVRDEEGGDSS